MSQVTIYLPTDVERDIRRAARRARKSLSAFVADLARRTLRPTRWPAGFAKLYGSWEGAFPEPPDERPEDVAAL